MQGMIQAIGPVKEISGIVGCWVTNFGASIVISMTTDHEGNLVHGTGVGFAIEL